MAKEAQDQNKEKLKALQLTMDKIERSYGKGAIMKLGDGPSRENTFYFDRVNWA